MQLGISQSHVRPNSRGSAPEQPVE